MSQTEAFCMWLEWRRFYVDATQQMPQIVLRDGIVLDANEVARGCEIELGMPLQQARTICRDLIIKPWKREEYVERQMEWLAVCADYSGIIEPIDQHIAALDLSAHPDRLYIAERVVRELVARMGLPLMHGAAHTKWIARLAAHKSGPATSYLNPELFLSEFPVEDLPVPPEQTARLKFLGYATIGSAAQVPFEVLKGQFGGDALALSLALKGKLFQPLEANYPPDSIRECFLFESPVEDEETIQGTLALLARRVAGRLNGRNSTSLELAIECVSGEIQVLSRTFTKPIYSATTLKAALRLLFPDVDQSIAAIRIRLGELKESKSQQHQLVVTDARPAAAAAVGIVQKTFGDHAVRLAGQIEIPRRERVLREWRAALGWQ